MKKVLSFLIVFLVLSLAGTVCAFDVIETPPLFYLVAGSFQSSEYAHNQQEKLLDAGYSSELLGYPIERKLYWRVVVGQDPHKKNLENLELALKKDGFSTFYAYDSENEPERPVDNPEAVPVSKSKSEEESIESLIKERFKTFDDFLSWLKFALVNY
jgi:hypothetical protein